MANATHPYKLNLPIDVKEWLVRESKKNLRSQSNEVIIAIRERMKATSQAEAEQAGAKK